MDLRELDIPQVQDAPNLEETAEEWGAGKQYALVELSGNSLAVEIGRASQILELLPITPVPHTPSFVLGVCNVRGAIYSIVELRMLLGLSMPERVSDPLMILLEGERYSCGATIEGVSEISWIPDSEIVAPPTDIPYISGLFRKGQNTVLVLDVDALFQSPEMVEFQ